MSLQQTLSHLAVAEFILAIVCIASPVLCFAQEKPGDTLIGKAAPELALKDRSGKDFRLSSLKGKVVLLEFWATWCSDCREALPSVQELYTKYTGKGLEVVMVSVEIKTKEVAPFMEKNGYTFPALIADRKADELRKTFLVKRIPTAWLLDKKGMVRAGYVEYGKKGAAEVEAQIVNLLGEK